MSALGQKQTSSVSLLMSALGQKRTLSVAIRTSALGQKQTLWRQRRFVRKS